MKKLEFFCRKCDEIIGELSVAFNDSRDRQMRCEKCWQWSKPTC